MVIEYKAVKDSFLVIMDGENIARTSTEERAKRIVSFLEKEFEIVSNEAFDDGHSYGQVEGHSYGQAEGYDEGFNDGFEKGNSSGYDNGYGDGYEEGKEAAESDKG